MRRTLQAEIQTLKAEHKAQVAKLHAELARMRHHVKEAEDAVSATAEERYVRPAAGLAGKDPALSISQANVHNIKGRGWGRSCSFNSANRRASSHNVRCAASCLVSCLGLFMRRCFGHIEVVS